MSEETQDVVTHLVSMGFTDRVRSPTVRQPST